MNLFLPAGTSGLSSVWDGGIVSAMSGLCLHEYKVERPVEEFFAASNLGCGRQEERRRFETTPPSEKRKPVLEAPIDDCFHLLRRIHNLTWSEATPHCWRNSNPSTPTFHI